MAETNRCPKCGAELAPDAPAGLCPECLLKQGLESGESQGGSTTGFDAGFVAPEPADLARHFPQLEILGFIGKGGMGAVYKARQKQLDRVVALKILPPEVGRDPAFAERFGREARALAQLNHHNIVDVYDFGDADGLYYLTMEYVDGTNLRELIRSGGLAPEQALAIVPQICEALQFAHDEGIVHRDIKPENILVNRRGQVKIADFGLAKLLGKAPAGATLTGTQQVMGTLHYMAPEQMQGSREVDHRADIYSLGVVFYEMLTGQLPIGRFEPPSRRVQVDVRLDEVVLRTLESDPQRRYQHASDVKTDVQSICSTTQAAETADLQEVRGRPIVRMLAIVAAVLLGFAALKIFRPDLSDTIWTMVVLLSMLAFVVDLIRHRQRLKGLQAAFILLAAAVGVLSYLAAQPGSLLDAIYEITGGEPGADDQMAARIIIGVVILVIAGQMFDVWKRIQAKRRQSNPWSKSEGSDTGLSPQRPRLVPVLATLNLAVAMLLMFIYAAPDPEPIQHADSLWPIYEQVSTTLGFVMAAGLFAASVGLYLWRPWARKLTIGVMIFGLTALVIDIPYMARVVIPEMHLDMQIEFALEGMPPDSAESSAMLFLAMILGPLLVIGLTWNIGQIVYFTRPRAAAAFERSSAGPG